MEERFEAGGVLGKMPACGAGLIMIWSVDKLQQAGSRRFTDMRKGRAMPKVLDGRLAAQEIKDDLRDRVTRLKEQGATVGLGTLLVGDDPASAKYVAGKHRDCAQVGIESIALRLPQDASKDDVISAVEHLNTDPSCTGYIVQLPLPRGIDEKEIIEHINPSKDADGMHPYNLGKLVLNTQGSGAFDRAAFPLPCTPRGIIVLLRRYDTDLNGRDVCVLGRGITVGRTVGLLLTAKDVNATVHLCHTGTADVHEAMREADVIISATGVAGSVRPEDVKPGAVLVDVGISRVFDESDGKYHITGDIDRACRERCGAYTPNPGGVGPMTRAMLLTNVVEMAERTAGR